MCSVARTRQTLKQINDNIYNVNNVNNNIHNDNVNNIVHKFLQNIHKMKIKNSSIYITAYQKNLEFKKEPPQIISAYCLDQSFPFCLTYEPACLQARGCKRGNLMVKPYAEPVR